MNKYLGLGFILLLGIAFWYVHSHSYRAGVNAEQVRWQTKFLAAQQEIDTLRAEAEKVIIQEKVVYRDRIKTIRETVNDCTVPDDILRVLTDSGIYTGEVSTLRPTDIQ